MSPKPAAAFYTSPLSRLCAEELPGDFHYLDGDEILLRYSSGSFVWARSTNVLRILESKRPGEEIRRSQRDVLPLLAQSIALSVEHGQLAPTSGVFIIEGSEPWNGAVVRRLGPPRNRAIGPEYSDEHRLTREQLERFIRCRPFQTTAREWGRAENDYFASEPGGAFQKFSA